jgi:hypothetical protein
MRTGAARLMVSIALSDQGVEIIHRRLKERVMSGQTQPNILADLLLEEFSEANIEELLEDAKSKLRKLGFRWDDSFNVRFQEMLGRLKPLIIKNKDKLETEQGFFEILLEACSPGFGERVVRYLKRTLIKRRRELFFKKYGETLGETVRKARRGERRSLWRLIEWDITFLFKKWVKGNVLSATWRNDRVFLERLGTAISKTRPPFGETQIRVYRLNQFLTMVFFLGQLSLFAGVGKLNNTKLMKSWFDALYQEDIFRSADFDYFLKFLKRHNLL